MHTKTLQQKYDFKNGIGMNAYSSHSQPKDEMKGIWANKKRLITLIETKWDMKSSSLECWKPEDLEELLKNGPQETKEEEGILNIYL